MFSEVNRSPALSSFPRHERGFYWLLNSSKAETAYCSGHQQNKQCILSSTHKAPMLRRLSLGLLASAISIAALPAIAQEGSGADDLGVMSISLKDVVKPTIGFQGALQGAGTPNQAGIGGFLPLSVGDNSVWFLDVLANANFADRAGESSIINTDVAGTTISTSSRLGYRWLNGDRSWMYGLNAGYDSRPMNTGEVSGINLFGTEKSVFFQQIAGGFEAISEKWNLYAYAARPIGERVQRLNWVAIGGALDTYGLDIGYQITPEIKTWAGYYYQSGDKGLADGSGVEGGVQYEALPGLTLDLKISYDHEFEERVIGGLKYRFNSNNTSNGKKLMNNNYLLGKLSSSPEHRNVRVMDCYSWDEFFCEATDWLDKEVAGGLTTLAFVNLIKEGYKRLPSSQREFAESILEDAEAGDDSTIFYECIYNPLIVGEIVAELG